MNVQTKDKRTAEPSATLITIFAIAAGALVANLYYAQPLIAEIGKEIHITPDLAGSISSVTQIGYGVGLFLLVSLADLVENKRLVLTLLTLTTVGLVGAATSQSALPFFVASFIVGVCSTAAQVLLPFIAHLVPEAKRGRIVGNVMAGVLTGIMLARPAALFISAHFGWRAVFWFSVILMIVIGSTLFRIMPSHRPATGKHYFHILRSMVGLFRSMPILRERALYQALMFTAFNMFWTAAPIMLADQFGMSQQSIALFALAGAGGALAAPIAGRFADRGYTRIMTIGAMSVLAATSYAADLAVSWQWLAALVVITILFDAAIQTNQITSQRIIFSVPQEVRGRVNAIYMTINFIGGAIGSVLGTITLHWGGWSTTAATGTAIGIILLLIFFVANRSR
ncbi:MFS transporter [Hyphomicrobium sp. 802]|uniref:MFS transporter n=1 Tax=Hyphomicrobium sp. 802 TaxID=1112272 RepID=UPI00045E7ABB|nr:MFS transporter [Hyphomicrobium sp. 802]